MRTLENSKEVCDLPCKAAEVREKRYWEPCGWAPAKAVVTGRFIVQWLAVHEPRT